MTPNQWGRIHPHGAQRCLQFWLDKLTMAELWLGHIPSMHFPQASPSEKNQLSRLFSAELVPQGLALCYTQKNCQMWGLTAASSETI